MKLTSIFLVFIFCISSTVYASDNENNIDTDSDKLNEEELQEKERLNEEFENEIKKKYQAIVLDENDIRRKLVRSELISAEAASPPSDEYVSVGIIVCNVTVKGLVKGIMRLFGRLIKSMFAFSKGTPLHIVVITDKKSYGMVHSVVANTIGRFLSETIIKLDYEMRGKWNILSTFPSTWVEFVDLESITKNHRDIIDMMKVEYSMNKKDVTVIPLDPGPDGTPRVASISPKYSEDLFYIGPFYGYNFKNLNRLIMLDADVVVKKDLSYLDDYFEDMDSDEIMGITADQAGYYSGAVEYLDMLEEKDNIKYIQTDDPIKRRGLNTGVVLYNLEKIRQSETMTKAIEFDNIKQIKKDVGLPNAPFQVGDQDFLTILMLREPQLFKVIPCEWNHQDTPVTMGQHFICDKPPKILHKHGDIHDEDK